MKAILFILLILLAGCTVSEVKMEIEGKNLSKAIFAGGCFWCMEAAFEGLDGIIDVVSGYTGGTKENPTYAEVSSGVTGHYESIQITYNPKKINYKDLLDLFWRQIDPTDDKGQFSDRGPQYKTVIFYSTPEQKRLAEESKKKLDESSKFEKPIVTAILPAEKFYIAEEYHQDYSKKRTIQYKLYEAGSGRKKYIKETWGE